MYRDVMNALHVTTGAGGRYVGVAASHFTLSISRVFHSIFVMKRDYFCNLKSNEDSIIS